MLRAKAPQSSAELGRHDPVCTQCLGEVSSLPLCEFNFQEHSVQARDRHICSLPNVQTRQFVQQKMASGGKAQMLAVQCHLSHGCGFGKPFKLQGTPVMAVGSPILQPLRLYICPPPPSPKPLDGNCPMTSFKSRRVGCTYCSNGTWDRGLFSPNFFLSRALVTGGFVSEPVPRDQIISVCLTWRTCQGLLWQLARPHTSTAVRCSP